MFLLRDFRTLAGGTSPAVGRSLASLPIAGRSLIIARAFTGAERHPLQSPGTLRLVDRGHRVFPIDHFHVFLRRRFLCQPDGNLHTFEVQQLPPRLEFFLIEVGAQRRIRLRIERHIVDVFPKRIVLIEQGTRIVVLHHLATLRPRLLTNALHVSGHLFRKARRARAQVRTDAALATARLPPAALGDFITQGLDVSRPEQALRAGSRCRQQRLALCVERCSQQGAREARRDEVRGFLHGHALVFVRRVQHHRHRDLPLLRIRHHGHHVRRRSFGKVATADRVLNLLGTIEDGQQFTHMRRAFPDLLRDGFDRENPPAIFLQFQQHLVTLGFLHRIPRQVLQLLDQHQLRRLRITQRDHLGRDIIPAQFHSGPAPTLPGDQLEEFTRRPDNDFVELPMLQETVGQGRDVGRVEVFPSLVGRGIDQGQWDAPDLSGQ